MKEAAHLKEIAQTILRQIQFGDRYALMAWGARGFMILPESNEFQGGVQFLVNGLHFQGIVKVELRWVDVYTVTFLTTAGVMEKCSEQVYCDQLVQIIDWVETGA